MLLLKEYIPTLSNQGHSLIKNKLGLVVNASDLSSWEVKSGGSRVINGHPQLCNESNAELGYMRL